MSYHLKLDPKSRKAGRFIARVHRNLQDAFLKTGLKQQELATKLGINRSLVNRRLQGKSNLTLRSIAELAWAMDYDVDIILSKYSPPKSSNGYVRANQTSTNVGKVFSANHLNRTESISEAVYCE